MVTLALVAFGLVMVYSATSAAAAVGGNDPSYYLKRQGVYAALGIVLMILAQRWDYRRLRALAPLLVLVSLVLLVAVLAIGPPINGARRWISLGPAAFQPSELAKLALAVWAAAYFAKRKPPRDLRELWRPVGALAQRLRVPARARARPRHDDRARDHARRDPRRLRHAGARGRRRGRPRLGRRARDDLDEAVQPGALLRLPAPAHDAAGTGYQILQAEIGMGSGHIFGVGLGQGVAEDLLPPRGAHRHDAREHRRGARARRRRRGDRRVRAVRLRGPRHRRRAAAIRSASASPRGSRCSSAGRRR